MKCLFKTWRILFYVPPESTKMSISKFYISVININVNRDTNKGIQKTNLHHNFIWSCSRRWALIKSVSNNTHTLTLVCLSQNKTKELCTCLDVKILNVCFTTKSCYCTQDKQITQSNMTAQGVNSGVEWFSTPTNYHFHDIYIFKL